MIIKGRVLKEESKSINPILQMMSFPVPFIPVFLDNLNTVQDERIKSNTDLFGNFFFEVPNGTYELKVRDSLYQPHSEVIQFDGKEVVNRIIKIRKITI